MASATKNPAGCTFAVRRTPGGTGAVQVLEIRGDFDVEFADVFVSCAEQALGCALIVVDLSRVRFLDCHALGSMVAVKQRARRQGGTLLVRDPSPTARQVLDVFGLDLTLDTAPDDEAAGRHRDRTPVPVPG